MARATTKEKVTVTVDIGLLEWVDELVREGAYESRSAAAEAALEALHRHRVNEQFEAALAAFGPAEVAEEQVLAELGVEAWGAELDALDGGWPKEATDGAR